MRKIPIIVVTSFTMQGDRNKALIAGANGYIERPIDPDTFISQIEAFIPSLYPNHERLQKVISH